MNHRFSAGFSPYLRPRGGRAGVSLIPAAGVSDAMSALASFATAQGGQPALLRPSAASMRGTREPLGFAPISLAGVQFTTGILASVSQGIFRPSKMILANSQDQTNVSIYVSQILVGSETALVNQQQVLGSVFLATAVECGVTFPTAQPGITVSITVGNNTTTTTTVYATMLGEYIRGGGLEIGG